MPPADRAPPGPPSSDPTIERWNRRYRARSERSASDKESPLADHSDLRDPHPFLPAQADLLPATGRALDIACGLGRNSIWLAGRGFDVTAVDGSSVACEHLDAVAAARSLPIELICRDLERDELPAGPYDAIVNTLYLQRSLAPRIEEILAAGGLLLFATYLEAGVAGRAAPSFGLKPNELATLFPRLETLHYEEHDDVDRPWAGLAARKPSERPG